VHHLGLEVSLASLDVCFGSTSRLTQLRSQGNLDKRPIRLGKTEKFPRPDRASRCFTSPGQKPHQQPSTTCVQRCFATARRILCDYSFEAWPKLTCQPLQSTYRGGPSGVLQSGTTVLPFATHDISPKGPFHLQVHCSTARRLQNTMFL